MKVIIRNTSEEASIWAAHYIVSKIKAKAAVTDEPFVLGLPTGSTPLGTYKELRRMYEAGEVSFKNVITFNMDEYVGLPESHPESYHAFMHRNLFDHIDVPKENIHILNGNAPDLQAECEAYEEAILDAGGIDLFLGGIGEDGHIAFNEPFSSLQSRTRVVTLTHDTRVVNSRFFDNDWTKVPAQAMSVGVSTVCNSREVLILGFGEKKAKAAQGGIEGPVTHVNTLSALQLVEYGTVVLDAGAAKNLDPANVAYFKAVEEAEGSAF